VLSGGGARGAAHIGVLKVFEKEGIPIDCIAATSFGSLVGGLYSLGYSAGEIEKIMSGQDWDSVFTDAPQRRLTRLLDRGDARHQVRISFRDWNPELPTGLLEGQRLTETLDRFITDRLLKADYDFDRLPIPFRAVATNLIDGKTYVFRKGSMTEALRASMAIPLLFTPLEKDGMLLADGGLTDNLPVDVVLAMGADIVIAVDVTSPLLPLEELKTFVNVVDQSISLQMEKNVNESRKRAHFVLKPELGNFEGTDFVKLPEIIRRGEEEARRNLTGLKALVAGIAPRPRTRTVHDGIPLVHSVAIRGLKQIGSRQLMANVHVSPGAPADADAIAADVARLYATGLFDSVAYTLEPVEENRYAVVFTVKETRMTTLGASLRYDGSYNLVALAEFTARQLFNTPSTVKVSTQFGGLEDHFAALRLSPPQAQFLFLESRVEAHRTERHDIRGEKLADIFTDKREAAQATIGATIAKQLEMSAGYRAERVRIAGGSDPNRVEGSSVLAGLTFRLNHDRLDRPVFPRSGTAVRARFDKRGRSLGGDFDYSRFQVDGQGYIPVSDRSTIQFGAGAGYTHGTVPFYDLFYVGGGSPAERASRPFSGLDRDELIVNQVGTVGAGYRYRIFANPLSFLRQGFLTGSYNAVIFSTRRESPYDFDRIHGAAIGIALDTMAGPIQASGGWGESGRLHFYISIGPAF